MQRKILIYPIEKANVRLKEVLYYSWKKVSSVKIKMLSAINQAMNNKIIIRQIKPEIE